MKKTVKPLKTKLNKTTNLIIIDASGSMTDKINKVKGGIKQLLTDIKKDAKKSEIATVIVDFSADFNVLLNVKDSKDVDTSLGEKYITKGMTALYDAIGKGFQLIGKDEKNVFVSIITDGLENSSHEFNSSSVKALIEEKKALGWGITFMGTSQASVLEAKNWGISGGNTFMFADNSAGVGQTMSLTSNARNAYHSMKGGSAGGQSVNSMKYRNSAGKEVEMTTDSLLSSQEDSND